MSARRHFPPLAQERLPAPRATELSFRTRYGMPTSGEALHRAGAVPALFRADRNGHRALRAVLGGYWRRRLGQPLVDGSHHQKNAKRNDHEIDDGIDEIAVVQRWC